jgi:hypothetical protein
MGNGQAPPTAKTVVRGRCRCGHYPTHHMVTKVLAGSASYRLDPVGPCSICGASACPAYVPAGEGSKGA